MKAVILAAGRGSRMGAHTQNIPKCLLKLAGRPLLAWQLEALHTAGITDILIVRGYQRQCLSPTGLGLAPESFTVTDNTRWDQTNMLSTLLCANEFAQQEGTLVAYADIVYHPDHIRALAACPQDIAITCDSQWEALWRLRFGDPLLDAETFSSEQGLLRAIGGQPRSISQIEAQYMGLLKFTPKGWNTLREHCAHLGTQLVDSMDMTKILQSLLSVGVPIGTVTVAGKWCEGDSMEDLQRYEHRLAQGAWSHDWR